MERDPLGEVWELLDALAVESTRAVPDWRWFLTLLRRLESHAAAMPDADGA